VEGVRRVSRLERTLNKLTVVLAVAVLAVVLSILWYFGLFLPRLSPLIPQTVPLPAETTITMPTPPSKTLLETKPDPEEGRGGDGA
jgi:hypothetical protein